MSRGFKKAFVFLLLVLFVCGCYPLKESAPESRYMPQINPYSEKSQGGKRAVTLYFPLKGELYLGTYQSEITVFIENGDTVSEAVMRALAADTDPSLNLDKVFTDTIKKLALTTTYDEIVLTLSKEILLGERNELSSISAEEAEQRRLTVYAIVNTLTEATGCRKVQILADTDGDGRGEQPLQWQLGFLQAQEDAVLEPLTFNDELVFSPSIAVTTMIEAVKTKDAARLNRLLFDISGELTEAQLQTKLESCDSVITGHYINALTLSADEKTANALVDITRLRNGNETNLYNQNIQMTRIHGIWRINYASIETLLFP